MGQDCPSIRAGWPGWLAQLVSSGLLETGSRRVLKLTILPLQEGLGSLKAGLWNLS